MLYYLGTSSCSISITKCLSKIHLDIKVGTGWQLVLHQCHNKQPGDSTSPAIVKPIFHCHAKSFALGNFASPNIKDSTFALPNAKNTNMLGSLALGDANFLRWPCTFHFCV